jgi:hypothetical protein
VVRLGQATSAETRGAHLPSPWQDPATARSQNASRHRAPDSASLPHSQGCGTPPSDDVPNAPGESPSGLVQEARRDASGADSRRPCDLSGRKVRSNCPRGSGGRAASPWWVGFPAVPRPEPPAPETCTAPPGATVSTLPRPSDGLAHARSRAAAKSAPQQLRTASCLKRSEDPPRLPCPKTDPCQLRGPFLESLDRPVSA